MRFGGLLFETLLQGDVRRLYDEARTRQQGRRLDFVLTSMIPWIGEKPWEFAFDTGRKTFLATEEIHFVRNVLTNVPADPVARRAGPLRILVASAQPVGFGRLSVDQEVKVIRRGFENLIEDGLVTVDVIARTTPEQLHRSILRGSYQVVHFIGHGIFENNEGMLVFESGRGGEVRLGERSLREIFCKRGLSLVFLNACESGRGGRAEFNKGAAQSLVAHGLPALVANQYSVLDASATSFAQHFYWSLAQGLSVGQAAREARVAVNYTMNGEPLDWAVPVLYARNPAMRLCDAPPPPSATTGRRAPARRAVAGREVVVAMWDLDNVFPAIDRTIDTLNAVQAVFGFELARISAPLDIWDLNPQGEGQTYLWAERVAARLKTTAAELNADVVFCVTRHWLRNDDWMNLYGWWPELGGDPVLIFSVAGFEALPPEGPEADRALANTLTTCLAGYYANAESHERGAKDCPLAFGRKRDYQTLTGPQRFDAGCLRRIGGALGNKLPALNAILSAFQPADADR